jgi:dUTP pyrophosphatase
MLNAKVEVKTLVEDSKLPYRKHSFDAGSDLYSVDDIELKPLTPTLVRTGISIAFSEDYVAYITPRSGLSTKGISIVNSPAVIDAGYRGELLVNLIYLTNDFSSVAKIEAGTRIAQLLISPIAYPTFEEVQKLSDSVDGRAAGGFGSTGLN